VTGARLLRKYVQLTAQPMAVSTRQLCCLLVTLLLTAGWGIRATDAQFQIEASCYTLQLTASPAGFDSFKPQLDPFAPASNPVYASIHRCSHGILYPDQTTIGNVTYKLDPVQPGLQSSNASLTSQQKHLNPFVVWFGAMNVQPGLHTVQATINFNDPDYAPYTTWGQFTVGGILEAPAEAPAPSGSV